MDVKLLVVNEKASVKELLLGPETYIGRSPECQLRISSNRVSRKHCLIRIDNDQVTVRDLGSSNGTVLDGLTVAAGVDALVRPGSKLLVGPMKFVFDFDPPETVDKPAGYMSPTDILALADVDGEEDDTKDYLPSKAKQKAAPSPPPEAESSEPSTDDGPAPPGTGSSAKRPDDTVFDSGLADHARAAARRLRDSESVLAESGTDLLSEADVQSLADRPTDKPEVPATDPLVDDPILERFLKQFKS